jgi:hypothetical protein
MTSSREVVWSSPSGVDIPPTASQATDLIVYAAGLTTRQQSQITSALKDSAFDMAAEYVWRRAMSKLRGSLTGLGTKFIGEMLGNEDLDEYSNLETAITDFDTIQLAENLGVVSPNGSLKLRHSLETLTHFIGGSAAKDGEQFSGQEAQEVIYACVKYVLGAPEVDVSLEFSAFREKLLGSTLPPSDPQIEMLLSSPYFYLRTILSILLTAIKQEGGAKQENALANLNSLVEAQGWEKLSERERWSVGSLYKDVTAKGDSVAAKGLRTALSKVRGFDYVPENLRSNTFKKAAKALLDTHFSMNNFYSEPAAVRALASLGSTIPSPALVECLQAYLSVYLGNSYGHTWAATPVVLEELEKVTNDRWLYYFDKALDDDEIILGKLTNSKPAERFIELTHSVLGSKIDLEKLPKFHADLLRAALDRKSQGVQRAAIKLFQRFAKV